MRWKITLKECGKGETGNRSARFGDGQSEAAGNLCFTVKAIMVVYYTEENIIVRIIILYYNQIL